MGAISVDEFKSLTCLARGTVEVFEIDEAGWLQAQIDSETSAVHAKLRKRYAVPFAEPVPTIVKRWVAALVDELVMVKTGVSPLDTVYDRIVKRASDARVEMTDAAESEKSLTDLPLLGDAGPSGAVAPETYFYTETSPFRWTDIQRTNGRSEDNGY